MGGGKGNVSPTLAQEPEEGLSLIWSMTHEELDGSDMIFDNEYMEMKRV